MDVTFNPHQLDFDWRFSAASVEEFGNRIVPRQRLLLIGCPSLVEIAESKTASGLLIERNPYHVGSTNFSSIRADVRYYQARKKFSNAFDAAIFDAPWYPDEFLRWAGLALAYTRLGGVVSFTMWPDDVRPSAVRERHQIFEHLERVGRLRQLGSLSYEVPHFEQTSLEKSNPGKSFTREGLLFSLTKLSDHPLITIHFRRSKIFWKRYRVGSQQLALKLNGNDRAKASNIDFDIPPFTLSNTSRRNQELGLINVWSSNNVAARVVDPIVLDAQIMKLRRGGRSSKGTAFLKRMSLIDSDKNVEWGETWTHRA